MKKFIILMIIVCVILIFIVEKENVKIQASSNFYIKKNKSDKKELEYYFYTQVPKSLHYNFHPIPDSKETKLAHYCGEKTLFEAWSLSIRTGKNYKNYLPFSTQKFIEDNKNVPLNEVINNLMAGN